MSSIESLPAPDIAAPSDDKWRREQQAFRRLLPELLRSHNGEFVAIHEGEVVEAGVDKLEVVRRAYARFGYIPIFVSRAVAGPPEPARIPSPRRLDGPTSSTSPCPGASTCVH